MKKICIFLIKVHRFYYIFLGALIGVIVYRRVADSQGMVSFIDGNPFILIIFLGVLTLVPVIAFSEFYTVEERKTKEINDDINTFGGLVQWDNYFPIKIKTELPLIKRCFGYIYAILRPVGFLVLGYLAIVVFYVFK
jgi:hypothetical protein